MISDNRLKWIEKEELNRTYNEIFAYHGHDFKSKDLKEHFLGKIWYKPIRGKTVSIDELSEIENQNRLIIQNRINELKDQN